MKRLKLTSVFLLFLAFGSKGQNIGINDDNSTPKASAMLDVKSTSKGLLIPRIALDSTLLATPITSPETSLLIYNTATIHDVTPGYYYWNSTAWVRLNANADPKKTNLVIKTASTTLLKTENMVIASGDITLTLPVITAADDGLEISVKNTGTYMDFIKVKPQTAHTIDGTDSSDLTRWQGKTFVASGANWFVKEKEIRRDNFLDVSEHASFETVAQAIEFLGDHMVAPTIVRLGGGTYPIASTQTINLPHPLTIQGVSFGESIITCPDDGSTAFDAQTESYFKMLTFNKGTAAGIAINLSGAGEYYEIKDGFFSGFTKAIVLANNVELWLFEVDFENCTTAAVEIAAGTTKDVSFKTSECDFFNCAIGINLLTGGPASIISILHTTFYNSTSGQKGINYVPSTGSNNFRFASFVVQGNSYNDVGSFASGFDFSRTDGRDANIFVENNAGVSAERPHVKVSVMNNTSSTTITTSGTYYRADIGSSFQTSNPCKWDASTTTNKIVYLPVNVRDGVAIISGNISCSQGSKTANIAIVKNGITSTLYGVTSVYLSTSTQSFPFSTVVYLPDLHHNDYLEIYFTVNYSGATLKIDDLNWFTDTH